MVSCCILQMCVFFFCKFHFVVNLIELLDLFFSEKKDKKTKVSCFSCVMFTRFWLHLFWNKCVSPGSKHLAPSLRIQMPQFSMPEGNLRGPIEQVPQMLPMSASYQTPLQFAQMMSVPQMFLIFAWKVRQKLNIKEGRESNARSPFNKNTLGGAHQCRMKVWA